MVSIVSRTRESPPLMPVNGGLSSGYNGYRVDNGKHRPSYCSADSKQPQEASAKNSWGCRCWREWVRSTHYVYYIPNIRVYANPMATFFLCYAIHFLQRFSDGLPGDTECRG